MKNFYIKDIKNNDRYLIKCWVADKRKSKHHLFLDVYDSTGKMECIIDDTNSYFSGLCKITRESCVELSGRKQSYNGKEDFVIDKFVVIEKSSINLTPSPNKNGFNVFDPKFARNVIEHPTFYIRNKTLANVFYIKAIFKREIQNYFWLRNFVEFEAPTLTKQTLYDDSGAIWLENNNQKVSLSRCATFHLEPAIIAFEKIFTITNSHADEKVKTNRHLIEYLHLKAEMAWVNLEELIEFAQNMYYAVAISTYEKCKSIIDNLIGEKVIVEKLEKLNPKNHVLITYDEAVKLLNEAGYAFEYGKSLTTKQEQYLTEHFDENFVWVKYIPYTVEGFMFKRKIDNDFLTMTCDLIAPNGFGEILGCAEKMTDYDEIMSSMEQKGKMKDFDRYKDYVDLHKLGLPPHGGIGMGIERAVRYLLNINHVKYLKPFAVIKSTQINH